MVIEKLPWSWRHHPRVITAEVTGEGRSKLLKKVLFSFFPRT